MGQGQSASFAEENRPRLRKPKYKAVEFATIVVDHVGKKVYDLIDGRTLDALRAGFANTRGKEQVEAVTIDMSETYRSFVKETFPNARIVVDRFHVERLFVKKVNKYRKKITGDDRKNPSTSFCFALATRCRFSSAAPWRGGSTTTPSCGNSTRSRRR